jgi:hypothetical protein
VVNALNALYNVQGLGVRMAHVVEPGPIVKTDRVDYERASLPPPTE